MGFGPRGRKKPVAAAPSGCVLRVQKSLSWHAAAAVMIKCMLLHSMQVFKGGWILSREPPTVGGDVVVGRPRSHPPIAWRKRWQNGENNGLGVLRCCCCLETLVEPTWMRAREGNLNNRVRLGSARRRKKERERETLWDVRAVAWEKWLEQTVWSS